ncbi:radical SAM/SPASM domain-containing protein [Nocardiopsis quinghaiensis]|uniref:radical SAM/SPASM domain-containing protein n=1 Tax=Nocardiopsis quinghaiensis TaxID=464995 RepID=UPI00123B8EF5|nr:radical SAM protein [Nocardiopsis quinghaiensis]
MSESGQKEKYKPSRFNVITPSDPDGLVIYNSLRGSVYRIRPPADEEVHSLLHNRSAVLDRPASGDGGEGLFDTLRTKGFLVPADTDEDDVAAAVSSRRKHRRDVLDLIIMPTEACNFRCDYCYEDFALGRMLTSVREGVRRLVRERHAAHPLQTLSVSWFGGEPLVAFEVIEELSEFFQSFCAENGVRYSAGITTNGYLLTEDVARRCLDLSISRYQITVDGPRSTHDASRYLIGGGRTYDEIVHNLEGMSVLEDDFQVTLRTNFTEHNRDRVPELIDELGRRFSRDPRFTTIYRPVGSWGGPQDEETGAHSGKQAELHKLDLCSHAADRGLSNGDERMLRPNGSVCYAASPWSFVIRPNGLVNKCTVALRDQRNAVGRLDEEGGLNLDEERMSLWVDTDDTSDSGCQSCFFQPSCQGAACPLVRLEEGRRPCPPHKVWIGPTIETYASMARRERERT